MLRLSVIAILGTVLAATPAAAATPPGACQVTTISLLGPRLENAPDSGSSVAYANGLRQTSYEVVPQLQRSKVGDEVRLCVVERPKGCPKGDDRGSKYAAVNLRTKERWALYDSQHRCGGA